MSKAELTRQFIIEKVAPIFNKQGYAGTSLRDLTAATGLTKGAIYGNFESKEAVALAAFDYNLSLTWVGLQTGSERGASAQARLLSLPRFYRKQYPKIIRLGGCPILNTAAEVDDAAPPALWRQVQGSVRQWQHLIASVIATGQQTGEMPATADAHQYATLFISLVEGGILVARVTGKAAALHTSLDHIELLIATDLST